MKADAECAFRFRCPGRSLALLPLLARAWPEASPDALRALVHGGSVRSTGGRPIRDSDRCVDPGACIEVSAGRATRDLGASAEDFAPTAPTAASSEAAWAVLVPTPPWHRGTLGRRKGARFEVAFELCEQRGSLAELLVRLHGSGRSGSADSDRREVLAALARAGWPVLGDTRRGGILVAGGLRCARRTADATDLRRPDGWWPEEPVFPGETDPPRFRVSAATQRVLRRGHPWILADAESDDASRYAPGTLVTVAGPQGEALGLARIEGPGRLSARMWSRPVRSRRELAGIEERVVAALGRRASLIASDPARPPTDAYRLIHGEADGLPGLFIDRLGPVLRVLSTSPATGAYAARAIDAVVRALAGLLGSEPPVVEVVHLRDRPVGEIECTRLARGDPTGLLRGSRLSVIENGVRFWVDPGLARPFRSSPGVGLFLDQRENRARVSARAANGGRWLNLFAHTGAFSVALLAAGADEVVSVDLSRRYLAWLDENLGQNAIDFRRHRSVAHDGRRYLEKLPARERFDGVVIDPPTAAAAGRRFWSVARDLPPLVELALARLAPGGALLVSRNDRRRSEVGSMVRGAAERAGVPLADVVRAGPGRDFPRVAGFPEGDPFDAVLATRGGARRGRD